ncbi:MAG: ABC transporter substrate-binding protein [Pseudomonadota bacterium]
MLSAAPAFALNTTQAKALVNRMVGDINAIINSGRSEAQMIQQFEGIFSTYGDVPTIARSVLGPPARSLSSGELRSFTRAFQGYMARKYGKRFREFIGGQIVVTRAEPWKSHFQVLSTVNLRGKAPFTVVFRVSDRSGRDLFFDMLIEGISLLKTEAVEIGALLEQRRGNVARLTTDLQRIG